VELTVRRLGGAHALFHAGTPAGAAPGGQLPLAQLAATLAQHGCGLDTAQEALVLDALGDGRHPTPSRGGGPAAVSLPELSAALHANAAAAHAAQQQAAHGGRAGASAGPPPGMAAQAAAAAGAGRLARTAPELEASCAAAWTAVLAHLASEPGFAAAVEDLFARDAADGRGALDIHALAACLAAQGVPLTRSELAAFHADCDANMDGTITLDEFLVAVQRNRELRFGNNTY